MRDTATVVSVHRRVRDRQGHIDDSSARAHVGFWLPQPDFRIPERLSPGFGPFSDEELEAMYRDEVVTFVDYQMRLALRAISQNKSADLVMIYFEQPDGSGHQFTLTDPRQPTDPANAASIGVRAPGATGQDRAKVSRSASHLAFAYQTANRAVQRILDAVGVDKQGEPLRDVFVVSDHGMRPSIRRCASTRFWPKRGSTPPRSGFERPVPQLTSTSTSPAGNPDRIINAESGPAAQEPVS
jgi:hypothetical protein